MRTGPNSKKRLITRGTQNTGRAVIAISKKAREPVIERHTPQWWEMEAKKRPGVRCGSCGAVFLRDHWVFAPARVQARLQSMTRPVTCPACAAEKHRNVPSAFGELTLRNVSLTDRPQALQLIATFAARARSRNPEARVLSVDASKAVIVVRTTQNQLAVRLGKKLNESMKGGALRIAYSDDDLAARVFWTAPSRS